MTEATIEEGKSNAIISYLTIIGTIIAFYLNNDKKNDFASFHIRQALGLWLTFFALGYVIGAFVLVNDEGLVTCSSDKFCVFIIFRNLQIIFDKEDQQLELG